MHTPAVPQRPERHSELSVQRTFAGSVTYWVSHASAAIAATVREQTPVPVHTLK